MLYKRGKNWWVRFTIRGREIRVTSGTDRKTLAEEFERRLREQIWRETELGEIQHTWEEATERWLKEKAHKRSLDRDREAFAACGPHIGGLALSEIDSPALQSMAAALGEGRSVATVNRLMSVVSAVLRRAVQWEWLTAAPKVEKAHEEKAPPRWITPEQFEALCSELPEHAAVIARFAIEVGSRSSNVLQLRWDQVDLDRGVFFVGAFWEAAGDCLAGCFFGGDFLAMGLSPSW